MGGAASTDTVLAGDDEALFTVHDNSTPVQTLRRVDPATGRVLATRTGTHIEGSGVVLAGRLWVLTAHPQPHASTFSVQALDPQSLTTTADIRIADRTTLVQGAELAGVVRRADRIYVVYNGHHIAVIDAKQRRVAHRFTLPGSDVPGRDVQAVVDPYGKRMYVVTTTTRGPIQTQTLTVRNPDTGALLFVSDYRSQTGPGLISPVAASRGGIWITEGSGMTHNAAFHPADNLDSTTSASGTSAGGLPLTVTVYPTVAWLGSQTRLLCADPNTGKVRASINLAKADSHTFGIFEITRAGSRLFADYTTRAGTERLVTIRPPRRCGS